MMKPKTHTGLADLSRCPVACIVNPQGNQALPYSVSEAMQESDCAGQIALSITMALVNVQGLNEWENWADNLKGWDIIGYI
jgi:hypothetical protein